MKRLLIRSVQGDYPVSFADTIEELSPHLQECHPTGFVIDRKVFSLHEGPIRTIIGKRPFLLQDATEEEKTLAGVQKIISWLQASGFSKKDAVCAIGGGIVQDIVTFSTHCFYRGIPWHFIPTTLLSMSDSCIGAKCGINHNQYKNQVGVFHSPARVIVCRKFIDTLSDLDVASGYGEILKLYLTGGSWDRLYELEHCLASGGIRNPYTRQLIQGSLRIKKAVIEVDEYERDYRRVLNYGHSFGHSLEAITNHEIPHGLAVAWGMDLINFLALRRNLLNKDQYERVHVLIQTYLPFQLSKHITAEQLMDGARRDKKADSDSINLVFLDRHCKLKIVKTTFDDMLKIGVHEYLANENVYRRH